MSAALEFHAVTKRYLAGAHGCFAQADALRGVELCVLEGESVALVGSAGAGKSTLLYLAAGLLVPDSGVVRWFGDDRRTAATARASYFFTGARSVTHSNRGGPRVPHIQLIDAPESLPPGTVPRLAGWIERRRRNGDAVVVATRDLSLGHDLAGRVVTMRSGCAFSSALPSRAARAWLSARSLRARGKRRSSSAGHL